MDFPNLPGPWDYEWEGFREQQKNKLKYNIPMKLDAIITKLRINHNEDFLPNVDDLCLVVGDSPNNENGITINSSYNEEGKISFSNMNASDAFIVYFK
jgi:hypothetical protein